LQDLLEISAKDIDANQPADPTSALTVLERKRLSRLIVREEGGGGLVEREGGRERSRIILTLITMNCSGRCDSPLQTLLRSQLGIDQLLLQEAEKLAKAAEKAASDKAEEAAKVWICL
jgi:hypothetical protein